MVRYFFDSLFCPTDERSFRGDTSDREDMANVRLMELQPSRGIVEAVSFVATDPAFLGEMTIVARFEGVPGGTELTLVFKNLPPGVSEQRSDASRIFIFPPEVLSTAKSMACG